MGFHEEPVFIKRYLKHLRESFLVFLRLHGRCQNDPFRRNLNLSIKNVVTDSDSDLLVFAVFYVFYNMLFVIFGDSVTLLSLVYNSDPQYLHFFASRLIISIHWQENASSSPNHGAALPNHGMHWSSGQRVSRDRSLLAVAQ